MMKLQLSAAAVVGVFLMATSPAMAVSASDLERLPDKAAACTDFYAYVNGAWEATAQIAPDKSRTGLVTALREENTHALLQALREAAASPQKLDSAGKRLALRYFESGMDTAAIERRGLAPLQPLLSAIDAVEQREQLPAVLARLARHGIAAPIAVSISPDAKDKRRFRVSLSQSGLGLPDRDDYSRNDPRTNALRLALDLYQTRLLVLSGGAQVAVDSEAAAVRNFEAELAAASMTRAALRDPVAVYNLHDASSLAASAPDFDWATYFSALGLPEGIRVNVAQPAFARTVARLARDMPLPLWRTYLRLRVLDAAAEHLPAAYAEAHFAYHGKAILGALRLPPRDEKVLEDMSGNRGHLPLGEALGELFVSQRFGPAAKARAVQMVADIKAAMRARIERLDWMQDATKQRAIAKLDALALQIGYPERWKTYRGLELAADDYAGNWLRANRWAYEERLAELDHAVPRDRWFTSPHIVNAFAGSLNNIVFPAGILQPPFFDPAADDATNYGAIGAVIGHEITHHFDDRGRQFDEHGNLAPWWSDEDVKAYRARAAQLVRQFSFYAPLPGQHINGEQTLGENISDLGGIAIAYEGLQRALSRTPGSVVAGFSPEQRFFISFATIWREKVRDEHMINQLRTGFHSPPRYRVLGTLANTDAFASAFDCKAGARMLRPPAERITIW